MLVFEIKKLLKKSSSYAGILVAILLFLGFIYGIFLNGQLSGYSTDKIRGRESIALNAKIADENSGFLSNEQIEKIITNSVERNEKEREAGFFDVFSWYISKEFIADHPSYDREVENYQENGKFNIENVKLKDVDDLGLVLPSSSIKLGNFASWNQLFQLLSTIFVLIGVLLIYLLSPIFSGDKMSGIMPLLLTTKYGRTKLTYSKLTATFLITLSSLILIHGFVFFFFAYYFGFSGWDTSIQMNLYWKLYSLPFSMNFMQLYLIVFIYHVIALLFVSAVTALISYFTKNTFVTLSVSLGVFFLPLLLAQLFKGGVIGKLLTLFPISNMSADSMLLKLSNSETFFFSNFYLNYSFLLVVMMAAAVFFLVVIVRKQQLQTTL